MKSILSITFVFFYFVSFSQSRIDSNTYKRIKYLDYAQVTQDVYYSLDNDTIYKNGSKLLNIDTIYYAFKFEPYHDELKKRIIKGAFTLYLLNEKNDTLFKSFNECSDSILLSIPISKENKQSKLVVIEQTSFKKKKSNKAFHTINSRVLSISITNEINLNEFTCLFPIRCCCWIKSADNIYEVLQLYRLPVNDIILKTVSGVN